MAEPIAGMVVFGSSSALLAPLRNSRFGHFAHSLICGGGADARYTGFIFLPKRVHIMSLPNCKKPCADCPFRKDTIKGWLGAERMQGIIEQGSFVCHKKNHLQCAGHMLINGDRNEFVRLAERLGMPLELSGRELVFDSREACVAHHQFDS